jgi:hypothetical protein
MKKQLLLLSLFTINVLMAQVPSYVPTNGLVGYWPFNGNANDESGNGNNGVVTGATLTSDRLGNLNSAYSFNGINNYVSATRNNLNQFSVSLWFNTNLNTEISAFIDANISNWEMYLKNLRPTFTKWILAPSNYQELISTTTVPMSQWSHIVYTYSSNDVNVFLNGVLISYFTNVPLVDPNNGLYYFGASISGSSQFYTGNLDDIGIWNRALTQAEITGLYTTLGTTQTEVVNQIAIYPNPAKDQITIDCGNISSVSGWNYTIVNTLGQEVSNGVMNSQQNVVSLNTLNGTGVYLMKIFDTESNLISTKKIIKE